MLAVKERDVTEKAYLNNKLMIHKLAYEYVRNYGGDVEEIESYLNYWVVIHIPKHDPTKSALNTYLYNICKFKLIDHLANRIKAKQAMQECENRPCRPHTFHIEDLLGSVSPRAQELIKLVLDPPEDLLYDFVTRGATSSKRQKVAILKEYLAARGWKNYQMKRTFREVKCNLG